MTNNPLDKTCVSSFPPPAHFNKTTTNTTLKTVFLKRDGKKQFAVLPYEEFVALQERLADLEDLTELRKAKRAEGGKHSVPLADVKRRLGIR